MSRELLDLIVARYRLAVARGDTRAQVAAWKVAERLPDLAPRLRAAHAEAAAEVDGPAPGHRPGGPFARVRDYGCLRCRRPHAEGLDPLYAEHLYFQSKHGCRDRAPLPIEVFRRVAEV